MIDTENVSGKPGQAPRFVDIQTCLIHLAAAKTDALSPAVSRARPDEARENLSRAS